jgi:glycosyltransferase involved in cell wall biosynthesis
MLTQKVSIIIPVYNVEQYLKACIDSCLKQTYKNIELILVNDGSTDKSLSIINQYATNSNVKIINQENEGVSKARSNGLSMASGEWIVFVDSDDYIAEDTIEKLVTYAKKTNTLVCASNYIEVYDYKERFVSNNTDYDLISKNEYIKMILLNKVATALFPRIYHRRLFENIESTSFKLGEDCSLLIQLINKVKRVSVITEYLYYYRQRINSAVHSLNDRKVVDMYDYRLFIENYLVQHNYQKINYLNYFVVTGYVECLLYGGWRYINTVKEYQNISLKAKDIPQKLSLWQALILRLSPNRNAVSLVSRFLLQVHSVKRNIKIFFTL